MLYKEMVLINSHFWKREVAYNFDEYIEYRCSDTDMVAEPKDIAKFTKETFGIWYE